MADEIILSDRMKELLKEAEALKKAYGKKDEKTGFELKIYPTISNSIKFGFVNEEVAEFLINAAKENIDLETLGCQIGIQISDATLDDYKLMYAVAKELMEKHGLEYINFNQRNMFIEAMQPHLDEIENYKQKKTRSDRLGVVAQGLGQIVDTMLEATDFTLHKHHERFRMPRFEFDEMEALPVSVSRRLDDIMQGKDSRETFISNMKKEGIDLIALSSAISIIPKEASVEDLEVICKVAKELMEKHGLSKIGKEQADIFTEAMQPHLDEIENYKQKKSNFEKLEETIKIAEENIKEMQLTLIARSKGQEMIKEVESLLEAVERGDVSTEEVGDIGKILSEAKSLLKGIPTEEMKSWDKQKRFEEVLKTIKKSNPNKDSRDEQ